MCIFCWLEGGSDEVVMKNHPGVYRCEHGLWNDRCDKCKSKRKPEIKSSLNDSITDNLEKLNQKPKDNNPLNIDILSKINPIKVNDNFLHFDTNADKNSINSFETNFLSSLKIDEPKYELTPDLKDFQYRHSRIVEKITGVNLDSCHLLEKEFGFSARKKKLIL
ncbi:MAG: hypothetical protein ACTSRP_27970 [Candidatus Helarchaeota archaeon]